MSDKLIKIIQTRFAAAVAKVLTALAAGWFGVESMQAQATAEQVGQTVGAFSVLLLSAGFDMLINHLQTKRAEQAEQVTVEIVTGIEGGKTAYCDTVVNLSEPAVKESMSQKTRDKINEIKVKKRL
ncbi:MAG: hypothetical protein JKX85_11090 [Phycisphaeraceae bacterium]|nr:hypothetical protein [Phycisphaeraceae bacterium]